jgi:AcrR family transcriptional regulator
MPTRPAPERRPLRADAERNRRLILDTARGLFAAKGLHVGLDEIARCAGLGVGTVYRRFPDKETLVSELFDESGDQLAAAIDAAAELEDPWEALAETLRAFARMQAENRGLKELIFSSGVHLGRLDEMRARIKPRIEAAVTRAREAGVLRADVHPEDIALVNIMVGAVGDATRELRPETWERALTLLLDGLRAAPGAATALPGEPLTDDEVQNTLRASVARR